VKPTPATNGLLFGSFLFRKDLFSSTSLHSFWETEGGSSFAFHPQENPLISYYSREMGEDLDRVFFLSSVPKPREMLLATKLKSLEWEETWSKDGRRMVNVDIGFLSAENFILATTKNYSHRVFLGSGIYADLTYQFHQGKLQSFPWTYPDYLDKEKKDFFTWGRSFLLQALKAD
jgi:hypothetical protein